MDLKRRQFLETTALGTGALLAGRLSARAAEAQKIKPVKPKSTDPVALVPLTPTIWCSRVGFGTGMKGYQRSSNLTRMDRDKALDLIRFAYDCGIRMFDMADLYGTHQVITEALQNKPRDSYVLSTKIWGHKNGLPEEDRPTADVVVKRFLQECQTDYVDVVQLHCMMSNQWTTEYAGQMEILERLKQQGLIRAHGVSCHANSALKLAAETPWTDVTHVRINPEGVNMEGTVEEVVSLTQKVHDAGIGTIAMKVIGEGKFANDPELRKKSARFVANLDCIDVIIVGFEERGHITELLANVEAALKK
ncbi:MAG: aldo/keto reductase [Planctomycetaceae bacterium]|nr:aldo/keto reductase [Planctomycetaceae bacterium]